MNKITLGFSPCPNDCFIFDALVHNKIDLKGLEFETVLEDVETLNRWAMEGKLDVTKLSFHAYGHVMDKYILLRSGSALGYNCGPLLVSKHPVADLRSLKRVAIPGKLTTANFLLSIACPWVTDKPEFIFSEIMDVVERGEVDAGLIIHESRFTYKQRGLEKVMDLGEFWESLIHAPIPLGGIAMKRDSDPVLQRTVSDVIAASVRYAFAYPEGTMEYVRAHAQEMSDAVMRAHIALYVNRFSEDLGEHGTAAVRMMFDKAAELNLFPPSSLPLMVQKG